MAREYKSRRRSVDKERLEHATKPIPWAVSEWDKRRVRLDRLMLFLGILVVVCVGNEIVGMWMDKRYDGNGILSTTLITSLTALVTLMTGYMGVAAWDDKNAKTANLEAMALELEHTAEPTETEVTTTTAVTTTEATTEKITPAAPAVEEPSLRPPLGFAEN